MIGYLVMSDSYEMILGQLNSASSACLMDCNEYLQCKSFNFATLNSLLVFLCNFPFVVLYKKAIDKLVSVVGPLTCFWLKVTGELIISFERF